MILYNTLHLTSENENDPRIEILVDDFVEETLEKTNASVTEALEYVAFLKEEAQLDYPNEESPRIFAYAYDPVTNTAEELAEGLSYDFGN